MTITTGSSSPIVVPGLSGPQTSKIRAVGPGGLSAWSAPVLWTAGSWTETDTLALATGVYGQRSSYTQPAGSIVVDAASGWSSVVATINSAAAGAKFWVTGVHRPTSEFAPKANQEFHGAPGSSFNGAKVLTGWNSGSFDGRTLWYVDGQTQRMPEGSLDANSGAGPLANRGEDLYFNNVPFRRYAARADVVAGGYFFDLTANRIYIFDTPTGQTVETCQQSYLCRGSTTRTNITNVVFQNVMVEKFGNQVQNGPTGRDSDWSTGWRYENSTFRHNHGFGIRHQGNGTVVRGCKITTNGQVGIGGGPGDGNVLTDGHNQTVEYNEITNNNYAKVEPLWEAGSSKWSNTENLLVRRNWLHDEYDVGFWTDINNFNTVYEENLIEEIGWAGIFHEISYAAIIRNNIVRNTGNVKNDTWLHHSGIVIANSKNVQIYGNKGSGNRHMVGIVQQDRRSSTGGSSHISRFGEDIILPRNILVRDNDFTLNGTGDQLGAVGDYSPDGTYPWSAGANVRFRRNTYVTAAGAFPFRWTSPTNYFTFATWQGQGQDVAVTETDTFSGAVVTYAAGTRLNP